MTHEQWSEVNPVRDLITPYCQGNGVDLGSKGLPVVPWAIQVELPAKDFYRYQGYALPNTVEWQGTALDLPFKDGVLDWVLSSHLLEDFLDWDPILKEWIRVLKPGGYLIIQMPDHERFQKACRDGGGGNENHKHETYLGEMSSIAAAYGLKVISEKFTERPIGNYNILFIGQRALIQA